MSISLTHDEFIQRFNERRGQLRLPNAQELKLSGADLLSVLQDERGIHINLSNLFGIYIGETVIRVIDLVYQE